MNMEINPGYEKRLNAVLSGLGLRFDDLQYLRLKDFAKQRHVGRKLLEYTILKMADNGLQFGTHSILFVKDHLDEFRRFHDFVSLVIHDNDWGTYREETLILEGGAGFCMLSFPGDDDPVHHRDRVWLHDLSVLPGYRRRGYATRLVEACRSRAGKAGRKMLSLWVAPGTWMEEWYRRIGFEPDESLIRRDGNTVYNLML